LHDKRFEFVEPEVKINKDEENKHEIMRNLIILLKSIELTEELEVATVERKDVTEETLFNDPMVRSPRIKERLEKAITANKN
jgi:hypothetical protein